MMIYFLLNREGGPALIALKSLISCSVIMSSILAHSCKNLHLPLVHCFASQNVGQYLVLPKLVFNLVPSDKQYKFIFCIAWHASNSLVYVTNVGILFALTHFE